MTETVLTNKALSFLNRGLDPNERGYELKNRYLNDIGEGTIAITRYGIIVHCQSYFLEPEDRQNPVKISEMANLATQRLLMSLVLAGISNKNY